MGGLKDFRPDLSEITPENNLSYISVPPRDINKMLSRMTNNTVQEISNFSQNFLFTLSGKDNTSCRCFTTEVNQQSHDGSR